MGPVRATARRSESKSFYHKVPFVALKRLADRFRLGSEEYEGPSERLLFAPSNWQSGGPEFFTDAFNHVIEHLFKWSSGDRSEDHLAAAAWGCMALIWAEENGRLPGQGPQDGSAEGTGQGPGDGPGPSRTIWDEIFSLARGS